MVGLRSGTVSQVQLTLEVTEYAVSLQNSWHHNWGCVVCCHCISVTIRSWTAVCERLIDFGISELSDSLSQSDLFLPLIVGVEVIVAFGDTPTHIWWDSVDEGLTQRRYLYLHDTQYPQETDIHATGRIQTHNPSKWVAIDPCCRLHGHRDWQLSNSCT